MTTKRTTLQKRAVQSDERFLLIGRTNGPDLMLYERRLDYRNLGPDLQPSSWANLEHIIAWLHERSGVAVDDRLTAPGFVSRLPKVGVDPIDLALYLVQLARVTA